MTLQDLHESSEKRIEALVREKNELVLSCETLKKVTLSSLKTWEFLCLFFFKENLFLKEKIALSDANEKLEKNYKSACLELK